MSETTQIEKLQKRNKDLEGLLLLHRRSILLWRGRASDARYALFCIADMVDPQQKTPQEIREYALEQYRAFQEVHTAATITAVTDDPFLALLAEIEPLKEQVSTSLERSREAPAEALRMLQRLTEKVERANALQHTGGRVEAEDWAELYQLTNEARAIIGRV